MKNLYLLLGYGNSGKSIYDLMRKVGYNAIIYDDQFCEVNNYKKILNHCSAVLISPGVNSNHLLVQEAKTNKIPVLSFIEFCYLLFKSNNCLPKKIIGITGTNGKTTVTTMTHHIMKNISYMAGNVGIPWSDFYENDKIAILELSSFQLENCNYFKPDIAVLLNLSPDHIDRHLSYDNYINAKLNLIKNLKVNDVLIANYDDEEVRKISYSVNCHKLYFGINNVLDGLFVSNGYIKLRCDGVVCSIMNINNIKLIGNHNLINVMASMLISITCGVNIETIINNISTYKLEPYRLSLVKTIDNVEFYNDSKSTNLNCTLVALDCFENNIILIVGGHGKNEEYDELFSKKRTDKLKMIICYGESADELVKCAEINQYKNIVAMKTLDDVFIYLSSLITNSNFSSNIKNNLTDDIKTIVLFSPACSSYDQYANYVERGKHFNNLLDSFHNEHN